jgi:hypothetical protein
MRFDTLLATAGTVSLIFGLGFLFAPSGVLGQYGVVTDQAGLIMTQFFGAALVQLGLTYFLVRGLGETMIPRLALAGCVGELVGLWIAVRAQVAGTVNTLGWLSIAIYLLFALAFARFAFARPAEA